MTFFAIEDREGRISASDVYTDRTKAEFALARLSRIWPTCNRFRGGEVVEITVADAKVMAEVASDLIEAETLVAIREARE